MVNIPEGAKTMYAYPDDNVITIYGCVGKIIATYRCANYTVFKDLEKYLKEQLIFNNFKNPQTANSKTKTKIQQFSKEDKLIKTWSISDIFDSNFSFEEIKKVNSGYTQSHKGFKWKIIK